MSAMTLAFPLMDGVSVTDFCWGAQFPSTVTTALSRRRGRSPSPASCRTGMSSGAPRCLAAKVSLSSHLPLLSLCKSASDLMNKGTSNRAGFLGLLSQSPQTGGLNSRNWVSHSPGGWTSKSKVLAGLVPTELRGRICSGSPPASGALLMSLEWHGCQKHHLSFLRVNAPLFPDVPSF